MSEVAAVRREFIADNWWSDDHGPDCPYWYGRDKAAQDEEDCTCDIGKALVAYEVAVGGGCVTGP